MSGSGVTPAAESAWPVETPAWADDVSADDTWPGDGWGCDEAWWPDLPPDEALRILDRELRESLGPTMVSADADQARQTLAGMARQPTGEAMAAIDAAKAVTLMRELEELTGVIAAAQARLAVVLDAHTRAAQAEAGVPAGRRGSGVASQIGLARRMSPHRAGIQLGVAKALTTELPATMESLARGETTDYRATLVTRATAVLDPDTRRDVDAVIGPELAHLSDRGVDARARSLAYLAEPRAYAAAAERSAEERYVSIRPAPTLMASVTGCVPAPEGVACWAALDAAARSAQAGGDTRSLAQLRADLFVERLTGRNPATGGPDIEIGIVITDHALLGDPADRDEDRDAYFGDTAGLHDGTDTAYLTMTGVGGEASSTGPARSGGVAGAASVAAGARAPGPANAGGVADAENVAGAIGVTGSADADRLAAAANVGGIGRTVVDAMTGAVGTGRPTTTETPAHLVGYGPVPAPWARAMVRGAERDPDSASEQQVFWRRLFTAPDGTVQTIDAQRRVFSGALRRAIIHRDQYCRTPWCGAPIRDVDHVTPSAEGGHETWTNGQGLCQRCNLAKSSPGWRSMATSVGPQGGRDHVVATTTPTGHTYRSRPPPVPL